MKFLAQRIREIKSELVGLHLTSAEVVRVMSEQGPLPELWSAYVRLCEKQRAAICEWHRLSNPPPYIETVGGRSPTARQQKGDACRQAPRTMYANK